MDRIARPAGESNRTHVVTWYGGDREAVTIIEDKTHMDYGFRYGEMLIESDVTDQLGKHQRWISFGLYNARDLDEIK